jgi:superoxide dismutase, Fe-Mn family
MPDKKYNRRKFIAATSAAGIGAVVIPAWACSGPKQMAQTKLAEEIPFTQQPLLYKYNSLEPAIDAMTMEIHYSKHAAAYAKNLTDAAQAEGVDATKEKLTSLLGRVSKYSAKMRNNAGGHYNHEFFWTSMQSPADNNMPQNELADAIKKDFGSFDTFKTQFADAGKNRFGSGWAWLIKTNDNKLVIGSTPNQDNPLMDLPTGQAGVSDLKGIPLLGLDVWEHAYYLKYQNRRADYINAWWNLVNWNKVKMRFL